MIRFTVSTQKESTLIQIPTEAKNFTDIILKQIHSKIYVITYHPT